ncbi:Neuroligin-1 [Orchesella cincta]|uniref:Neuroligin-1 n=1 Tax=Orchesella cincta TaxID=48709 RepID=A0A1D2NKN9_ORCCI|nr:Neuroligin-1 [Orchesella cincta]
MLIPVEILWIFLVLLIAQPQLLWSMEVDYSSPQQQQQQWSSRVVSTKFGLVRGLLFQKAGYEGVEVFLGLPYASAPVGSLRLMPPVSGSPWTGTKMNAEPAPVCPQVLPNIANETEALKRMPRGRLIQLKRLLPMLRNQSEDCLYLNVYVPTTGNKL